MPLYENGKFSSFVVPETGMGLVKQDENTVLNNPVGKRCRSFHRKLTSLH
jgi:hypothetical protein